MCTGQPHTHGPRAYHTHSHARRPGADRQTEGRVLRNTRACTPRCPCLTEDAQAAHRPTCTPVHARSAPARVAATRGGLHVGPGGLRAGCRPSLGQASPGPRDPVSKFRHRLPLRVSPGKQDRCPCWRCPEGDPPPLPSPWPSPAEPSRYLQRPPPVTSSSPSHSPFTASSLSLFWKLPLLQWKEEPSRPGSPPVQGPLPGNPLQLRAGAAWP